MLDKKPKLPADAFDEILDKAVGDPVKSDLIAKFMALSDVSQISAIAGANDKTAEAVKELDQLFGLLERMAIDDYCVFDPGIVRGLAYYTGVVFEVHDLVGDLRAIAGGGRYDNLLADFGGPKVTGTGMGMGDCVLEILLGIRLKL